MCDVYVFSSQLFESLLSSLMMERPENPVEYIEKKMCQIRELGIDNVTWETLISHLHPYRDNIRRQYVRDGSQYDREYTTLQGEVSINKTNSQWLLSLFAFWDLLL